MRKLIVATFTIVIALSASLIFAAGNEAKLSQKETLDRIDTLFNQAVDDYQKKATIETLKQSLDLCVNALKNDPDNFELLWRCARSAGQYSEGAYGLQVDGWKKICFEWGKKGSDFGGRAQKKEPERVEGYFWQVVCVGKHAIATGLITAMKEGFYGKSKYCIEKAYEKDKSYLDYSPTISRSQFYFNIPWPIKNKKRALQYFEEYEKNAKWEWEGNLRRIVSAELLLSLKKDKYTDKAKRFIETALNDPCLPKKYREKATQITAVLNK